MYTFAQLKSDIRSRIWPSGAGEADNQVVSHDKMFIDALLDLQSWVKCLQHDHTDLIPQCATLYNCGLTVFDAPRGHILKLSVIDKIDPDTGLESADADDDYCSEITYRQVDPQYIKNYLDLSRATGYCLSTPLFFGFPSCGCWTTSYPTATDEGVPAGLPALPLGYHYPQDSTDDANGRSGYGIWAIERAKIFVAPWLQSTETIILKWDGIKRTWNAGDPVDPDPQFTMAVEEYVRWQHAKNWDRDEATAQIHQAAYSVARQTLWHECREENRVRGLEASYARASSLGLMTLYYNDTEARYTATCPDGQTGDDITVTISIGTVGSNVSIADANAKAIAQAKTQAEAQLVCVDTPVLYWNTRQTATAGCDVEDGAPPPVGMPVTRSVEAGLYSSSVSQAAADALAYDAALAAARGARQCTYGNAPQTAICPSDDTITYTVAANTYQSTVSQADADNQAMAEAQNQVNADAGCAGAGIVYNTEQICPAAIPGCISTKTKAYATKFYVTVTVPAGLFSGADQNTANVAARNAGQALADALAAQRGDQHLCQNYATTYPGP